MRIGERMAQVGERGLKRLEGLSTLETKATVSSKVSLVPEVSKSLESVSFLTCFAASAKAAAGGQSVLRLARLARSGKGAPAVAGFVGSHKLSMAAWKTKTISRMCSELCDISSRLRPTLRRRRRSSG